MDKLPKVLATSVIRASNKGESHGGLYMIDLQSREIDQIIDWNKIDINWEGRGLDRGMRGIAFHNSHIYTAISDEILIFDSAYKRVGSIKNRYLKHCHEIFIEDHILYITSTGFDSILEYDIRREKFTNGYCLRYSSSKAYLQKISLKFDIDSKMLKLIPKIQIFDPNENGGPQAGDSLHINNVYAKGGEIYASGRRCGTLLKIQDRRVLFFASIPYFTHNARPYRQGVIANSTKQDKIIFIKNNHAGVECFNIPRYDEKELLNNGLPDHFARQGFGRGLCCHNGFIIAGSSPATISVYQHGNADPICSLNITMDIRNAIHGLEVLED